jgi:hypothetical protein
MRNQAIYCGVGANIVQNHASILGRKQVKLLFVVFVVKILTRTKMIKLDHKVVNIFVVNPAKPRGEILNTPVTSILTGRMARHPIEPL